MAIDLPLPPNHSFAGSSIVSHLMPNDRSLWCLSSIPSKTTSETFMPLKISPQHASHSSYELFSYYKKSINASYTKWTHFIVVARVSVFMRDDRIMQNF